MDPSPPPLTGLRVVELAGLAPELEQQGYDQRPAVRLTVSPSLPIPKQTQWISDGLSPGHGGEDMLESWMGWKRGRDYEVEAGGLVKIETAKL
ncbi:hypothetical protein P7C71_g3252, partial [Lecanoromycetidae sp. Uapishka_2]